MTDPGNEEIARLAAIHVRRYKYRLEMAKAGGRGVVERECQHYLDLWQSIETKGRYDAVFEAMDDGDLNPIRATTWERLTKEEQQEVTDAVESGE